jgi:hypothetical protein
VRCVVVVPWVSDVVLSGPLCQSAAGVDTDTYKELQVTLESLNLEESKNITI